jgi:hydroxymethylglutaryl-CoA lyase
MQRVRYVECLRDAWQSLPRAVDLAGRRALVARCAEAGLTHLDVASFVSPRVVPQLADSAAMLRDLSLPPGSELLAIVVNERSVERALAADGVHALALPLSLAPAFERRNVGRDLEASWAFLALLRDRAAAAGRVPVVYLSMGFGNPDGEPWHPDVTAGAVERARRLGVERIVVADTVGRASAPDVAATLDACDRPNELGLHLHARRGAWRPLLRAALERGVRHVEGTLGGLGGCPFSGDELVGNLPTEGVVPFLRAEGFATGVDEEALPDLARAARALATAPPPAT